MKGKGKGDEKGGFKGLLKGSFEQAKGKGKSDYGGSKGEHGHLKGNRKGSGKPMYGGCWHCGGGHFARDCPAKGGRCWGRGAGDARPLLLWTCLSIHPSIYLLPDFVNDTSFCLSIHDML